MWWFIGAYVGVISAFLIWYYLARPYWLSWWHRRVGDEVEAWLEEVTE